MKKYFAIFSLVLLAGAFILVKAANTGAMVGEPAPDFTLTDSKGVSHSLSSFKGKYVVLEWINFDCPFVKKHYGSGNMQELQKKFTDQGVVWLSICSSAKGNQGHYSNDEINEMVTKQNGKQTAYLIDEEGKVGRMYNARTTPNMYVIDPQGKLIYAGAIDDDTSADPNAAKKAKNYVVSAIDKSKAGQKIDPETSKPYGCAVKY